MTTIHCFRWLAIASLFVFTLSACPIAVITSWKYGGESYETKEEAIAAQEKWWQNAIAKTTPVTDPLSGTLKFCWLSQNKMLSGAPYRGRAAHQLVLRTYTVEMVYREWKYVYQLIKKRRIFENSEYYETEGEECQRDSGDAAVLYYQVISSKRGGWYFSSAAVKKEPVKMTNTPYRYANYMSFLDRVEELAKIGAEKKR